MTVDDKRADLKLIVETVTISSPTQYSFLGEPRDLTGAAPAPDNSGAGRAGDGVPDEPVFLSMLETELYTRLYIRPAGPGVAAADMLAQRDHISALSAANSGTGSWEPGWKVVSIDPDGRLAVSKDQLTFWVSPTGLRTRTGQMRPGDFCRVRVGKELRQLMPGFYFAIGNGNQRDPRDATEPLVRLYWNLTAGVAVRYMGLVTTLLNNAGVPFRTKVVSDPGGYIRADAGVLYLERRYFQAVRGVVREVHGAIETGLRGDVPMFTKLLAPGLGLAEDPGNGLSFGQSRCRIAARGLWSCFVRGLSDPDSRVAVLEEAFKDEGLDPDRPFLEPGSVDVYSLLKSAYSGHVVSRRTPRTVPRPQKPKRGQKRKVH